MISRNGMPVIGFGALPVADAGPKPFSLSKITPILYPAIGAVGGGLLGHHIKKGTGTAIGVVVGGFMGGLIYFGVHFGDRAATQ